MNIYRGVIFLFIAVSILLPVVASEKALSSFNNGEAIRVSAEKVVALVEEYEDLVFIDSRVKSDIKKGYIEGSIHLTDVNTYGATLAERIPSLTTPVIFYAANALSRQSIKAATIAAAEGYTKVYWMKGGMAAWKAKGLPIVQP